MEKDITAMLPNSEDTTKNKKVRANVGWFKNSKKLYVERQDERKVKDLFVIDVLAQPRPKLETYRYSMPGERVCSSDRADNF